MLLIFSRDVYVLLDLGFTLYYVTTYMEVSVGFYPKNIPELFSISTPIGNSIMARRVYRYCVVPIFHHDTMVDLVEPDMIDFDGNGLVPFMLCYIRL